MKTYKIALTRIYIVEIDAKDKEQAKFLTEFYVSSACDGSTEKEKRDYGFRFNDIEMVTNEAFEAEEISA